MAKQDFEVHSSIRELSSYIEALDRKVEELIMLQDSLKSKDEVEALRNRIQEVKKDEEDFKKRFAEFMGRISSRIEGFKKEGDELKERLIELMIEFGKEGCCTFMFGDCKRQQDSDSKLGSEESDEGSEALKAIKDRAAELEAYFSHLLVVSMNMLSKNDQEAVARFTQGDKTNASNRIIAALRRADQKVKDAKTLKLIEFLEEFSASMEETALGNSELRESKVEGPRFQLFDKICQEILVLDTILEYPGLPESKILKKRELSALKRGLKECETALKGILIEKELHSFIFQLEEREALKREMESACEDLRG